MYNQQLRCGLLETITNESTATVTLRLPHLNSPDMKGAIAVATDALPSAKRILAVNEYGDRFHYGMADDGEWRFMGERRGSGW